MWKLAVFVLVVAAYICGRRAWDNLQEEDSNEED